MLRIDYGKEITLPCNFSMIIYSYNLKTPKPCFITGENAREQLPSNIITLPLKLLWLTSEDITFEIRYNTIPPNIPHFSKLLPSHLPNLLSPHECLHESCWFSFRVNKETQSELEWWTEKGNSMVPIWNWRSASAVYTGIRALICTILFSKITHFNTKRILLFIVQNIFYI